MVDLFGQEKIKFKALNGYIYVATKSSNFSEEEVIGGDPIYEIDGHEVTEDVFYEVKEKVGKED